MIAALLAAAAVSATPVVAKPLPQNVAGPAPHTIRLTDQDLETIRFMAVQIGTKCSATDDGYQFCRAALLARELELSIGTQVQAEGKKP